MGLNHNIWFDIMEMVASKIVGRETVQYVGNIFKYYMAHSLAHDRINIEAFALSRKTHSM